MENETAIYLIAFRSDRDPEYIKHKALFEFCAETNQLLPAATAEYFNVSADKIAFDPVVLDKILEVELVDGINITDYDNGHDIKGWEIDLSKLPPEVVRIRFYEGPDDDIETEEEDEYGDGEDQK